MNDQRGRVRLFDLNSQSAHCIHRVHAIFAREKSAQRAHAIGQGRDDHRAMRDALVAWYGDFEIDSRRPLYAQIHRKNLNVMIFMPKVRIKRLYYANQAFTTPHERPRNSSLYGTRKILSV